MDGSQPGSAHSSCAARRFHSCEGHWGIQARRRLDRSFAPLHRTTLQPPKEEKLALATQNVRGNQLVANISSAAAPTWSKGRLIRCTVLGSTPKRAAILQHALGAPRRF